MQPDPVIEPQPPSVMPESGSDRAGKAVLGLVIWSVIYVPLSFCFPEVGHAPSGLFAPLILPLLICTVIFDGERPSHEYVTGVVLPGAVFGAVVAAILLWWLLPRRVARLAVHR